MEISTDPFIRFLDLLVKKTEEEDFIYNLTSKYLTELYNESNKTNHIRINLLNKNKNLYPHRTETERTWTFCRFAYKIFRDNQIKNNIINMDEHP